MIRKLIIKNYYKKKRKGAFYGNEKQQHKPLNSRWRERDFFVSCTAAFPSVYKVPNISVVASVRTKPISMKFVSAPFPGDFATAVDESTLCWDIVIYAEDSPSGLVPFHFS